MKNHLTKTMRKWKKKTSFIYFFFWVEFHNFKFWYFIFDGTRKFKRPLTKLEVERCPWVDRGNISAGGFRPRVGHRRCQRWKRRKNKATGHCLAWAMYQARASPISSYLNKLKTTTSANNRWFLSFVCRLSCRNNNNHNNNSLGIRLMALNGRKTRIVLMADKFMFSMSRQYSTALS